MLEIRATQPGDVEKLSVIMHPLDIAECRAMGQTPWGALHAGRRLSTLVWTGAVNGWPEAMFGVVPVSYASGRGRPWFLGSTAARKQQRAFLREAPQYLEEMEKLFPRLDNWVSVRNTSALRWLRRLGFVVEHKPKVFNGEPMLHFHKGFRDV